MSDQNTDATVADTVTETVEHEPSSPADPKTEPQAETLAQKNARSGAARGQVTVSIPALVAGLLVIALIISTTVFVARDISARSDLNAITSEISESEAAMKVAGEYAVAAATLNYEDVPAWIASMKKGVSPDLARQYEVISSAMEQFLTALRMQTTAELVTTSLESAEGDLFRVTAVVNVTTKNVQIPNGSSRVAVYEMTLDRSQDWLITEVGDPTDAVAGNLGSIISDAQNGGAPAPAPSPAPAPAPAPAPGN